MGVKGGGLKAPIREGLGRVPVRGCRAQGTADPEAGEPGSGAGGRLRELGLLPGRPGAVA